MTKLTLEQFQKMCELNLDKTHVKEIIETIKNLEFKFHPGIIKPKSEIISLYKLRLKIVKENGTRDLNFIHDYEKLISQLQNSESETLGITALIFQDHTNVIFYEPDRGIILGVLKGAQFLEIG